MPNENDGISVSLKRYIETIIELRMETINERFRSDEQARILALRELEQWKNTHNEFQRRIERMNDTLITNDKLSDRISPVSDRLAKLEQWQARALGAGGVLVVLAGILGALLVKTIR